VFKLPVTQHPANNTPLAISCWNDTNRFYDWLYTYRFNANISILQIVAAEMCVNDHSSAIPMMITNESGLPDRSPLNNYQTMVASVWLAFAVERLSFEWAMIRSSPNASLNSQGIPDELQPQAGQPRASVV
jgi:hypothetical protein